MTNVFLGLSALTACMVLFKRKLWSENDNEIMYLPCSLDGALRL